MDALGRFARVLAPCALLSTSAACAGDGAQQRASAGGTAVYCTATLPDQLNTFVTPDVIAADARWLLYTPLVRYDSAGNSTVPWLATGWRWNAERTELAMALRTDVVWHDGEPLDAEDVVWTLRTAADPTFGYAGADDLAGLTEVVATARDSVRLRFGRPLIAELEPFIGMPILPRHLLDTIPADRFAQSPYHREPVGSGPFRFVERTVDGAIVLARNDAFPETLGRAALDRLVLRGIPEPTAQLVELETGNIQVCIMGASRAAEVERSGRLHALAVPPVGVYVLPLDTRRAPLNDARVRRALSAALDRTTLAASLSPVIRPARTFLLSSSTWLDSTALQLDGDTAHAAALLDSAGWRPGANGMRRDAACRPLQFALTGPQPFRNLLTVVQSQWRAVGIDVALRFMEGAAYISAIRNPDTRPAAMTLSFFPDLVMTPDPWEQLHSTGGSNLASYRNAAVDSLAALLRTPIADAERAALYHALQRYVAHDVPLVYLLHAPRLLAVSAELEGVHIDANGPFASASSWRSAAVRP
jgi:peptide/nickel transport system substrate-binding protein